MDCTYKGWVEGTWFGEWWGQERGGLGGGGEWEAGGGLYPPIGLFGVAMSPRTTSHRPSHRPRQAWRA